MKIYLGLIMATVLLLSACGASHEDKVSLEVRNSTSNEITKIVVFSESAERGVRLLNIAPTGLASWYPLNIRLSGPLNIKVWWGTGEMAACSIPITKQDEETIRSHKYLIVAVRELEVQLLTGDDPDKAAAIKTEPIRKTK